MEGGAENEVAGLNKFGAMNFYDCAYSMHWRIFLVQNTALLIIGIPYIPAASPLFPCK